MENNIKQEEATTSKRDSISSTEEDGAIMEGLCSTAASFIPLSTLDEFDSDDEYIAEEETDEQISSRKVLYEYNVLRKMGEENDRRQREAEQKYEAVSSDEESSDDDYESYSEGEEHSKKDKNFVTEMYEGLVRINDMSKTLIQKSLAYNRSNKRKSSSTVFDREYDVPSKLSKTTSTSTTSFDIVDERLEEDDEFRRDGFGNLPNQDFVDKSAQSITEPIPKIRFVSDDNGTPVQLPKTSSEMNDKEYFDYVYGQEESNVNWYKFFLFVVSKIIIILNVYRLYKIISIDDEVLVYEEQFREYNSPVTITRYPIVAVLDVPNTLLSTISRHVCMNALTSIISFFLLKFFDFIYFTRFF